MAAMDEPDELLDLVDADDRKIGTILREEIPQLMAGRPGFVRSASAFVVNTDGKLWVPRRAAHKKIAPNGLDFSVGEHVQAGETYLQALVRGFIEELGMEIDPQMPQHIVTLRPSQTGVPYFEAIFMYSSSVVPAYNQDDFASHEWLSPKTLQQRLKAGESAKKGLLPAIEYILAYNMNVKE